MNNKAPGGTHYRAKPWWTGVVNRPSVSSLAMSAALFLPLLLCQCATPKALGRVDEEQAAKMPIMAHFAQVWRSTGKSFARSPLATIRSGFAVSTQRTAAMFGGSVRKSDGKSTGSGAAEESVMPVPGTAEFESWLDQEKLPKAVPGTVKLLVDGGQFFPEFQESIANANRSIDSQTFIFDNDDFGMEMASLYKRKAAGIPVRIFMDNLGTRAAHKVKPKTPLPPGFEPPLFMGDHLREDPNIKLRTTTNPFWLCDHTKLHVIDGRTAYVGGMNIGREYRSEWHDQMARIEGPVVAVLEGVFRDHWQREDWRRNWTFRNTGNEKVTLPAGPVPAGAVPLRVLRTDSAEGKFEIDRALRAGIAGARKRVWMESPYMAEEGLLTALTDAAKRGVDVRVIMPGDNDSGVMEKVNLQSARKLMESGVKVFSYPKMSHLKVTLCDGWGTFGSANGDTLSLKLNRELNLASSAPGLVEDLEKKIFVPDFKVSRQVTPGMAGKEASTLADIAGNQL
ncbi:MAG: hypothetical protein JWL81_340 [Verrucomicrobiales bacterium]|nr:hypothetical protein [Verrucomicrobiales bacterium]